MTKACKKFLHITYNSQNTWGYAFWNAISSVTMKQNRKLPQELQDGIGDLILAVSVRIDYLPQIIKRINDGVLPLYEEMKTRDKSKDGYSYEPSEGIKLPLLIDLNSFLFEVHGIVELLEELGKMVLRRALGATVGNDPLVRTVLVSKGNPTEWLDSLVDWRNHFSHRGTPWIAVCLDAEPTYDLLIMKNNVHQFKDTDLFFRLSELNGIRDGILTALKLVQDHIGETARTIVASSK